MDSIIEIQRQTHEEVERLGRALATVLSRSQTTQQAKLASEHKASDILDRVCSRVIALNNQYQDQLARQTEIEAISGQNRPDDLTSFYSRLESIKEYHAKYPGSTLDGFELELALLVGEGEEEIQADDEYEEEDPIANLFSGEESYGRYLDLYTHHTAYNNLKGIRKRAAYLQYLDTLLLAQDGIIHKELSKETRFSKDYELYMTALHNYLLSFTKRANPLKNVTAQQAAAVKDFEVLWEEGKLEGWEESNDGSAKKENPEENENIWCNACQKFYTKKTVYEAHLKSKKHIKLSSRQVNGSESQKADNGSVTPRPSPTSAPRIRSVALLTYLVTSLLKPLAVTLNETKSNVERRFSLTAREREAELMEKPSVTAPPVNPDENATKEEEEEEERIYNPLKLPLGWDGKPIPYWLYKLHGLGVEYRCEICSDYVYMGRKNFDRHFQESRHAFGMRALGLPNTKHFHEITRIEDALALAEKLKQEGKQEIFQQETMEELEDDEGNVYNRKTYEDLKKQGII